MIFDSQFTVENDEGTVILDTGGTCDITNSGTQCSGSACTSASNNNCYRRVISGIEAQKICVKMDCENWSADCNVNAWTVGFYVASVASPPPTSTTVSPPPPPPTAASPNASDAKLYKIDTLLNIEPGWIDSACSHADDSFNITWMAEFPAAPTITSSLLKNMMKLS